MWLISGILIFIIIGVIIGFIIYALKYDALDLPPDDDSFNE